LAKYEDRIIVASVKKQVTIEPLRTAQATTATALLCPRHDLRVLLSLKLDLGLGLALGLGLLPGSPA